MMHSYDLCLAWNWEYDVDFVAFLEAACIRKGVSLLLATPANVDATLAALRQQECSFRAFLDRASDSDPRFLPLAEWARTHAEYRLNPQEKAILAWDKAAMHVTLHTAGVNTPHTLILPPYTQEPALPELAMGALGPHFAIKPSHGGGGDGVLLQVTSLDQVKTARQMFPDDHYLLQFHIEPVALNSHRAWFRILYCGGLSYPCWWHIETHIYTPVTPAEVKQYALHPLFTMLPRIAALSGMDMFSTEIALTAEGQFVVVDYVNDPIDLRLQSKALDGVPDQIVQSLTDRLTDVVQIHCPPPPVEHIEIAPEKFKQIFTFQPQWELV